MADRWRSTVAQRGRRRPQSAPDGQAPGPFTFGLLYGFGFASALSEVGLPQSAIPVALLFFNVGVELGQLMFIATVFAVIAAARGVAPRMGLQHPPWAWRIPPYVIGSVATFWVIPRVAAF